MACLFCTHWGGGGEMEGGYAFFHEKHKQPSIIYIIMYIAIVLSSLSNLIRSVVYLKRAALKSKKGKSRKRKIRMKILMSNILNPYSVIHKSWFKLFYSYKIIMSFRPCFMICSQKNRLRKSTWKSCWMLIARRSSSCEASCLDVDQKSLQWWL